MSQQLYVFVSSVLNVSITIEVEDDEVLQVVFKTQFSKSSSLDGIDIIKENLHQTINYIDEHIVENRSRIREARKITRCNPAGRGNTRTRI